MTKKTVEKINAIHAIKIHKSVLKNIVMDFYSLEKLTQNEAESLIKKYRLQAA